METMASFGAYGFGAPTGIAFPNDCSHPRNFCYVRRGITRRVRIRPGLQGAERAINY